MQSKNIGYLPRLDHLRLLAALLVFGFHFFHHYLGGWQAQPEQPWLAPIVEGHTGVSLFFVLSGFIFTAIALGGGEIDYRGFLRNRLLRIFPLFLVVFVVAISIGRDRFQPTDVFYLLFTNLGLAPTSWHFVTGPAWSISVEFAFYLVFPFLARFVRERGAGYLLDLLLLLVVIKLAAYAASEKSTHMLYSTLVGRFDQFVWGMLAAIAWQRHGARLSRLGSWPLLIAALAVFAALALQARHASFFLPQPKQAAWIWWSGIEGLLWAGFVLAYLSAALQLPARLDRWLASGGEWSFSFYMWHTLVIFTVHHYVGFLRPTGLGGPDLALNAVPVLALALAFAWLSYQVIEKPFLQMRGGYLRSPSPHASG